MPLELGTTLGPYAVTAKIGEDGMGEVYRARDTKLDRDVALKVLPQAFTDDPDRLARFEREGRVLFSKGTRQSKRTVVVDTQIPGWGQAILDQLRSVTDKPVTVIINTHTHGDHVGSNAEFPTPVEVVAHEHTKTSMADMDMFQGESARHLPSRTFSDRMSLFEGEDRIDLYYFGRAHTDGDTIVTFPSLRAAHTGDLYPCNCAPLVTRGGSSLDYSETLQRAVAALPAIDTIMPGHGEVTDWQAFVDYAAFNRDLLAAVRQALDDGLTVEEAADSLRADARFAAYNLAPFGPPGIANLVSQMYSELGR